MTHPAGTDPGCLGRPLSHHGDGVSFDESSVAKMRGRAVQSGGAVLVVLLSTACGPDEDAQETKMDEPQTITVKTTAFGEGDRIPERYTCDGDNISPPLAWKGIPDDAEAVALVMDDPDAPNGTFTHWVVLDIPRQATSVPEADVPPDGVQIKGSAGKASYFGPCPPSGTHQYRFTVYALSAPAGLDDPASLDEALRAIDDSATAWGRLTAVYARS
jgi:Raf kinase inhibitor-like YbhB/YbcL family protein